MVNTYKNVIHALVNTEKKKLFLFEITLTELKSSKFFQSSAQTCLMSLKIIYSDSLKLRNPMVKKWGSSYYGCEQ